MIATLQTQEDEDAPEHLTLRHEVQKELFLMSGGLHPSLDVTSYSENSSLCPRRLSVEEGLDTDLAGEFVYAHPGRHDIHNVLEHYWECKTRAPTETSGIFVLPSKACPALIVNGQLMGMELLKTYQGGDRVLMPTNKRKNPATVLQVWYDPPDVEFPAAAVQTWRDRSAGGGSVFSIVRHRPADETGVDNKTLEELTPNEEQSVDNPGPACNSVQPHAPEGPRYPPSKWDGKGVWKRENGRWWRPASDPKIKSIQMIARKKTKYNRNKQQLLQTVKVQITGKMGAVFYRLSFLPDPCCNRLSVG